MSEAPSEGLGSCCGKCGAVVPPGFDHWCERLPLPEDVEARAEGWRRYVTEHRPLFEESLRRARAALYGETTLAEYRQWHEQNVKPVQDSLWNER